MRGIFGLIGILVTLAIVGVLVKKQLGSMDAALPAVPGAPPGVAQGLTPGTTPQQQSTQIQQQVKQSVDAALQTPRGEAADK